jgi:hypothetical protein
MVLVRAMAAAWRIEVPDQVALQLRVRDLPTVVRQSLPARTPKDLGAAAGTVVLRRVARRAVQAVPGLGAGLAGWSTRRRMIEAGGRMRAVYERACEAVPFDLPDMRPAVLVSR